MLFQTLNTSLATSLEFDTDAYMVSSADSSTTSGQQLGTTTNDSGLFSGYGSNTYFQGSGSSATQTGQDTVSAQDYQSTSLTLYEAGVYSNGDYNLSSVVQVESSADNYGQQRYSTSGQTVVSSSGALDNSNNATLGYYGSGQSASSTNSLQSSTQTLIESSQVTVTMTHGNGTGISVNAYVSAIPGVPDEKSSGSANASRPQRTG